MLAGLAQLLAQDDTFRVSPEVAPDTDATHSGMPLTMRPRSANGNTAATLTGASATRICRQVIHHFFYFCLFCFSAPTKEHVKDLS